MTEKFCNETDKLNALKKNQQSETDNTGLFDVKELPSQEDTLRNINLTHPETNINLQNSAQPGKGGFFNAIKNFFVGLFKSDLQMPKSVPVWVANYKIDVSGERFRGMIEALPKGERDRAVGCLGKQITTRLKQGEKLLNSVLFGKQVPLASTKGVSDMMLYIQLRHEAMHPDESFTNGVYSIEDPDGRLAHFLDSCNEGYNRSSSHLKGLQSVPLGLLERNAMRGIDIPGGVMTGLLDNRGTIHYGSIPKQYQVDGSTRRLFIKTERHGCRLSLRSLKFWTKSFWVNTSGRAHRFMRLSDIGKAILNCFEKSDEKSGINYRSEKLPGLHPKDIVETFKRMSLCQEQAALIPFFRHYGSYQLPENARLCDTLRWLDNLAMAAKRNQRRLEGYLRDTGENSDLRMENQKYSEFVAALDSIKSTLIHGMYTENPNNEKRTTERSFIWFLTSAKLDHIDRLGNEVMMSLEDFEVILQSRKNRGHFFSSIQNIDNDIEENHVELPSEL